MAKRNQEVAKAVGAALAAQAAATQEGETVQQVTALEKETAVQLTAVQTQLEHAVSDVDSLRGRRWEIVVTAMVQGATKEGIEANLSKETKKALAPIFSMVKTASTYHVPLMDGGKVRAKGAVGTDNAKAKAAANSEGGTPRQPTGETEPQTLNKRDIVALGLAALLADDADGAKFREENAVQIKALALKSANEEAVRIETGKAKAKAADEADAANATRKAERARIKAENAEMAKRNKAALEAEKAQLAA